MSKPWRIVEGDLADPRVIALLHTHVASVQASTAPGSAHALDVSGLQSPDIQFWTAWHSGALAGCVALKMLAPDHGEVKSMHVAATLRGRGLGAALLAHVMAAARGRSLQRLSLETGSWDFFKPAHALYRSRGFAECAPFGAYCADRHSLFFTIELRKQESSPFL